MFIIKPLIGTLQEEIGPGLAGGKLKRWGGVIRVAKGQPGAGQIVKHLRDVGPLARDTVSSGLPFFDAAQGATAQVGQVSQQLTRLLQLSHVGAAASVLNLGVSVVGFLLMNHKLNKLQASVGRIDSLLRDLHADATRRFDAIDVQLVELRYLAMVNLDLAEKGAAALQDVRQELFDDKFGKVLAAAARLIRLDRPDASILEQSIHEFEGVRFSLQASLGTRNLGMGSEPLWMDELMRYRLWCSTSAALVMALRKAEKTADAARVASEVSQRSRTLASNWQRSLMPTQDFGGVYRLGHSRFETTEPVPMETRFRLARLQAAGDVSDVEMHDASREGSHAVAHAEPSLPQGWFAQQRAAAAVLDFVEETTERLESMAEEMNMCERRRLAYDEWEGLALPEASGELAVIEMENRSVR